MVNDLSISEEDALELIENIRWKGNTQCPRCNGILVSKIKTKFPFKNRWYCRSCKYKFSVLVGTAFQRSRIPLKLWVRAFYLLCVEEKGVTIKQIQRDLEIGSYKSAWHIIHMIRTAVMPERKTEKIYRFSPISLYPLTIDEAIATFISASHDAVLRGIISNKSQWKKQKIEKRIRKTEAMIQKKKRITAVENYWKDKP